MDTYIILIFKKYKHDIKLILLLLLLCTLIGVSYIPKNTQVDNPKSQTQERIKTNLNREYAYAYAQQYIEQQLKTPSVAVFAPINRATITSLGGGRYEVKSYVDSQNSYGAKVRQQFTCIVKDIGNDHFQYESSSFK